MLTMLQNRYVFRFVNREPVTTVQPFLRSSTRPHLTGITSDAILERMEIVQDTNVFVAALRSRAGASAEVLDRCLARDREMKTIPYRCDNTRHKALLGVARSTGTSVQRLFDNFVTHVIA